MNEELCALLGRERAAQPAAFAARVELVRTRVNDGIYRSSLRSVARQVKMSPTGLSNFCGGADPQVGTMAKLWEWYERVEFGHVREARSI